tara:strand:- start:933 stop:1478 length:546 start_codon:yes stop_codon:yes gene_type:complete
MENVKQINIPSEYGDLPNADEMISALVPAMQNIARGPAGDNAWFARQVIYGIVSSVERFKNKKEESWYKASKKVNDTAYTSNEIDQNNYKRDVAWRDQCEFEALHTEAVFNKLVEVYNELVSADLLYEGFNGDIQQFCQYGKYKSPADKTTDVTDTVSETEKQEYIKRFGNKLKSIGNRFK